MSAGVLQGFSIYSCVNMSYIHVPKTLSYARRKQSLLANTISRALKHLRIQPQTGKILEIHICMGKICSV